MVAGPLRQGLLLQVLIPPTSTPRRLVVGKAIAIPPILSKMSALSSPERYLCASEAGATEMMRSFGKVVSSSEALGKLAREFPSKK